MTIIHLKDSPYKLPWTHTYSRGSTPINFIVVHWAGSASSAEQLYRYLQGTRVAVSTGWGVDPTGAYQYLPETRVSYHAGKANKWSVGVDFTQSPLLNDLWRYSSRAGVAAMDNTTGRGDKQCLSIGTEELNHMCELIHFLCDKYNIPMDLPTTTDVLSTPFEKIKGVVCHSHLTNQKWDIAPWWNTLRKAL